MLYHIGVDHQFLVETYLILVSANLSGSSVSSKNLFDPCFRLSANLRAIQDFKKK